MKKFVIVALLGGVACVPMWNPEQKVADPFFRIVMMKRL
jgi:hypothetical protein